MKTVIRNKKRTQSRKSKVKGEPKLYEGMFLVDSAEATTDWDGVIAAIRNILEKAGAEIVVIKKWDDRKLAYTIKGKNKGTYILCYFKAEGGRLRSIERDVQLSERILRVLILCAEHMRDEDIKDKVISQSAGEKEGKEGTAFAQADEREEDADQTLKAEDESGETEGGETEDFEAKTE